MEIAQLKPMKNSSYNIYADDILFDYYLPKYPFIRSDFHMSNDGCSYWVRVMKKAASKGYKIIFNIEVTDPSKTNFKNGENLIDNNKIKMISDDDLYKIIRAEKSNTKIGYHVEDITIVK